MGKIVLSSIQQPLAQNAPRTNIYEGREVDPGRIRAQVQGGPEIRNGAAAGLASLAQGLSAWTGVVRAWSSRKEPSTREAPQRRPDEDGSKVGSIPGPAEDTRPKGPGPGVKRVAGPDSAPAGQESPADRDLDLDRAALLEAVRAHDGEMAAFAEGQDQLNSRQAIDDPLTGNQGLTGQALNWMKDFDQKFQPRFRRPETGEMYRQAVEQHRSRLLEQSELRQVGEEEVWREEVFESDLDLMIRTMFEDPTPQRLAELEAEIDTLWPEPESEERRADVLDRSYGRIAQTILDGGNLGEAEAFISQYQDRLKTETVEKLHQAMDRKESELVLSHTALVEVLPDLAADELKAILADGQASEPLDELYRTAEEFWDLPPEKASDYRRGRQEAQAANEWLNRPDRAFKPFPELLAEAERELKTDDGGSGLTRHALVERELLKRRREFNDDPIGHIGVQRDAAINRLLAQGDLSEELGPELTQMKIALGRSLAKKMGMEDRGLVLSREEAGQYGDQLAQAAEPSERLELLVDYDKLFGRYSERAFRQLNIPAEEQWAARLFQSGKPEVGRAVRLAFDGLKQMPPDEDQESWLAMARAASETMMSPWLQGLSDGSGRLGLESDQLGSLCRLVAAAVGPAGAENSLGSANSVESLLVGVLGDAAKPEPAKASAALRALGELKRRPEDAAWLTEFLARKLAWAEMEKSPEAKSSFLVDFRNWQSKKGLGPTMPLPYNYLPGTSPGLKELRPTPYTYQSEGATDQKALRPLPYAYKQGVLPDQQEMRPLPYIYQPGQAHSLEFRELQGRTEAHRLAEELVDKAVVAVETVLDQVSTEQAEGAVPKSDWLDEAVRGFGIGSRGVMDGFLNVADLLASPLRMIMNKVSESLGYSPNYFQPAAGTIPDAMGLPQPAYSSERLAYNVSEALATLPAAIWAGQMLIARGVQAVGGGGAAAVGEMLAAEPAAQAAAGLGAAGALTVAQEAGANPLVQFFTSLFGGLVGGGIKPKASTGKPGVPAKPAAAISEEVAEAAAEAPNPAAAKNPPAGPNKKESRDFTDHRTQEEMEALHTKLQAIKPTTDDFLYTPPKEYLTNSLPEMKLYAENLNRDLGVISNPVEVAPGKWKLKIEQIPPRPSVSELKPEIQRMFEAAQRGENFKISFGVVGPEEAARIKAQTGLDALLYKHELNLDNIRHALQRHGDELAKGQASISEDDFVRYAEILADPHWIEKGSKPGSIMYSRRYPDGTVFAIEQQLKGKNMSFRTLWKQELGGTMVAVLVAADLAKDDEQ